MPCSEALPYSSLLASGPSQVRICLGLARGKEVGSEGQFLISPHRLDSAAAATSASGPRWIGENWFSDSLPFSPPLSFLSLSPSLLLSLSISLLSTPDARSAEPVTVRHRPAGWKWLGRRASRGAQALQSVKRGCGGPRCARSSHNRRRPQPLASQKPASGLFHQPSRVHSLGLLGLGFLLRLGSQWEEQGQVPGTSPGMQGSFPAVRRGLTALLRGIPAISSASQGLCRGWSWCGGQAWGILESCGPQAWGKAASSWAPLAPAGKGIIS